MNYLVQVKNMHVVGHVVRAISIEIEPQLTIIPGHQAASIPIHVLTFKLKVPTDSKILIKVFETYLLYHFLGTDPETVL